MNEEQMQAEFDQITSKDVLVSNVVGVIGDVLDNKHPTSVIVPGLMCMDLKLLKGFYQEPRYIQEMVSMYIGRTLKFYLEHKELNIQDRSIMPMALKLLASTTEREAEVCAIIMAICIKKYGIYHMDEKLNNKYLNKIDTTISKAMH